MNETEELRFMLGALLDVMCAALQDGEDIDCEFAWQRLEATGLAKIDPETGIVLSDFATQCMAEFQHRLTGR
jgi:hypothetical protein